MKKLTTLILLCLVMAAATFSSCTDYSDDIKMLQEQIDALQSEKINTIDEQVTSIKSSLSTLQGIDKELQTYIDGLKSQLESLMQTEKELSEKIEQLKKSSDDNKKTLSQFEEYKSIVTEQISSLKSTIETLQTKDKELQSQIDSLKAYIDTEIKKSKDWASATFATLEQYNATAAIVATISAQIETINSDISLLKNVTDQVSKSDLDKAISDCESAIKNWVNSLLEGYYTAEQTDAKIAALKDELGKSGNVDVKSLTKDYEAKLSEAKKEMTEAYTSAISKAINDYNGTITTKMALQISTINGKISALQSEISALEKRVASLEERVSKIEELLKIVDDGTGDENDENDENETALSVAEFINKANTSKAYTLTGKVLNYKVTTSSTGNNYSFDILDDTGSVLVYSFTNIEDWKYIEIGGTITLSGIYNYNSSAQRCEVVDASIMSYSYPDANKIQALSIREFLEIKDPKNIYELTGRVQNFNSDDYSFNLTDGRNSIYVYNLSPNSRDFCESEIFDDCNVTLYGGYYCDENNSDLAKSGVEILGAYVTTIEYSSAGYVYEYQDAAAMAVAEFISIADKTTYYKLSGTVSNFDSKYCSFNLTDASGTIYVYNVPNNSDWSGHIYDGGRVTLAGKYNYSSENQHEVVDAYILSSESGGENEDDDQEVTGPANATKVTVSEFLSREVNATDWYEITGTIASIANAKYGNFYVEDETGGIFVYGLTKGWTGRINDQSFFQIGLNVGDKITFWTLRAEFDGIAQAGGDYCPALYISHEPSAETYPTGSLLLTFPDDNKDNNAVNSYSDTWTAKSGNNEFNIENFNNYEWTYWTYIKCGRKKDPSVAKITNATAVESKIAMVVVNADFYDATSVNSLVMNIYSDSAHITKVCTVDVTESVAIGEIEFAIPTAYQAKGLFYEIVFDCKESSASRNGFIQISKVAYIAAE